MYSTTQANNIAMFCGIASIILAKMGVSIGSEELQMTIGMGIALVANIMQYIHRFKKGDVNVAGFKKS